MTLRASLSEGTLLRYHVEIESRQRFALVRILIFVLVGSTLCVGLLRGDGLSDDPLPDVDGALWVREPRVVGIKSQRILHLFDGGCLVRSYPIDLGSAPVGQKARKGDGRTPEGLFKVVRMNPSSRYHRFLGISYPDRPAVDRGLVEGYLSDGDAAGIRLALREERRPAWNTGLGGGVGIHGHRRGVDWTGGCVALSDRHVEELYDLLRDGDPIEILP